MITNCCPLRSPRAIMLIATLTALTACVEPDSSYSPNLPWFPTDDAPAEDVPDMASPDLAEPVASLHVRTRQPERLSDTALRFRGELVSLRDKPVVAYGFCVYRAEELKPQGCSKLGALSEPAAFSQPWDGLEPGTRYAVRAYANDAELITYGQLIHFTTPAPRDTKVETHAISFSSPTTIRLEGALVDEGIPAATSYGACISPVLLPDQEAEPERCVTLSEGIQAGSFEISFDEVIPGRRYRGYAFARAASHVQLRGESLTTEAAVQPVRALHASDYDAERVRLSWDPADEATSFEVFKGRTHLASIPNDGRIFRYGFDDYDAPQPPAPKLPRPTIQTSTCQGAALEWPPLPAAEPGLLATYTVFAVNDSGFSDPAMVQGRRAAPQGPKYQLRWLDLPDQPTTEEYAPPTWLPAQLLPELSAGDISASLGTFADRVVLSASGGAQGAAPHELVEIKAISAAGESQPQLILYSRSGCQLMLQWQRAASPQGPFEDIPGARGGYAAMRQLVDHDPVRPTSFYRAQVFLDGVPEHHTFTPVVEGAAR